MGSYKKVVVLIILFTVAAVWVFSQPQEETIRAKEDPELKASINTCDGITERAAANLVAIVEFQKLEIAGRKAHVFKMCMQDHGYIENPNWLAYSKPIAKAAAVKMNVSIDAALESLRRESMMTALGEQGRPTYWMLKKPAADQ